MAFAFLCGGIVSRAFMQYYLDRKLRAQAGVVLHSVSPNSETFKEIVGVLWYGAKRQGLAVLSSSLIQQSDILICAIFLGLSETATYGISLQLFTMAASTSVILFNTYMPRLNEAGLRGDLGQTRRDFSCTLVISWAFLGIGTLAITTIGPAVLKWFGPDKQMLPFELCMVMGLVVALETNYGIFYAFLTTRNRIPPPAGYLITGIAQPIISTLLIIVFKLGFWGLLLSRLFAQLAYLSWKWPQLGLRELHSSLLEMMKYPFSQKRSSR